MDRYFSEDDATLLTASACAIVLRKDLSLSRRLYTWLLSNTTTTAGEDDPNRHTTSFSDEAMTLLIRSLDVRAPLSFPYLLCGGKQLICLK